MNAGRERRIAGAGSVDSERGKRAHRIAGVGGVHSERGKRALNHWRG